MTTSSVDDSRDVKETTIANADEVNSNYTAKDLDINTSKAVQEDSKEKQENNIGVIKNLGEDISAESSEDILDKFNTITDNNEPLEMPSSSVENNVDKEASRDVGKVNDENIEEPEIIKEVHGSSEGNDLDIDDSKDVQENMEERRISKEEQRDINSITGNAEPLEIPSSSQAEIIGNSGNIPFKGQDKETNASTDEVGSNLDIDTSKTVQEDSREKQEENVVIKNISKEEAGEPLEMTSTEAEVNNDKEGSEDVVKYKDINIEKAEDFDNTIPIPQRVHSNSAEDDLDIDTPKHVQENTTEEEQENIDVTKNLVSEISKEELGEQRDTNLGKNNEIASSTPPESSILNDSGILPDFQENINEDNGLQEIIHEYKITHPNSGHHEHHHHHHHLHKDPSIDLPLHKDPSVDLQSKEEPETEISSSESEDDEEVEGLEQLINENHSFIFDKNTLLKLEGESVDTNLESADKIKSQESSEDISKVDKDFVEKAGEELSKADRPEIKAEAYLTDRSDTMRSSMEEVSKEIGASEGSLSEYDMDSSKPIRVDTFDNEVSRPSNEVSDAGAKNDEKAHIDLINNEKMHSVESRKNEENVPETHKENSQNDEFDIDNSKLIRFDTIRNEVSHVSSEDSNEFVNNDEKLQTETLDSDTINENEKIHITESKNEQHLPESHKDELIDSNSDSISTDSIEASVNKNGANLENEITRPNSDGDKSSSSVEELLRNDSEELGSVVLVNKNHQDNRDGLVELLGKLLTETKDPLGVSMKEPYDAEKEKIDSRKDSVEELERKNSDEEGSITLTNAPKNFITNEYKFDRSKLEKQEDEVKQESFVVLDSSNISSKSVAEDSTSDHIKTNTSKDLTEEEIAKNTPGINESKPGEPQISKAEYDFMKHRIRKGMSDNVAVIIPTLRESTVPIKKKAHSAEGQTTRSRSPTKAVVKKPVEKKPAPKKKKLVEQDSEDNDVVIVSGRSVVSKKPLREKKWSKLENEPIKKNPPRIKRSIDYVKQNAENVASSSRARSKSKDISNISEKILAADAVLNASKAIRGSASRKSKDSVSQRVSEEEVGGDSLKGSEKEGSSSKDKQFQGIEAAISSSGNQVLIKNNKDSEKEGLPCIPSPDVLPKTNITDPNLNNNEASKLSSKNQELIEASNKNGADESRISPREQFKLKGKHVSFDESPATDIMKTLHSSVNEPELPQIESRINIEEDTKPIQEENISKIVANVKTDLPHISDNIEIDEKAEHIEKIDATKFVQDARPEVPQISNNVEIDEITKYTDIEESVSKSVEDALSIGLNIIKGVDPLNKTFSKEAVLEDRLQEEIANSKKESQNVSKYISDRLSATKKFLDESLAQLSKETHKERLSKEKVNKAEKDRSINLVNMVPDVSENFSGENREINEELEKDLQKGVMDSSAKLDSGNEDQKIRNIDDKDISIKEVSNEIESMLSKPLEDTKEELSSPSMLVKDELKELVQQGSKSKSDIDKSLISVEKEIDKAVNHGNEKATEIISDQANALDKEAKQLKENIVEAGSSIQKSLDQNIDQTLEVTYNEVNNTLSGMDKNIDKILKDESQEFQNSIKDESEGVKEIAGKGGSIIKEAVQDVGQKIKEVEKEVDKVVDHGTESVNEVSEAADIIGKSLSEDLQSVEKLIKDDSKKLKDNLENEASGVEEKVKKAELSVQDKSEEVKDSLEKEGSTIKESVKDVGHKIKDIGTSVKNIFKHKSEAAEKEVDNVVDHGTESINEVSERADIIGQSLSEDLQSVEKLIRDDSKKLEDTLQNEASDQYIDQILEDESESAEKEGNIVKRAVKDVGQKVKDVGTSVKNIFKHKTEATAKEVDEVVNQGTESVNKVSEGAESIKMSLSEDLQSVEKSLKDDSKKLKESFDQSIDQMLEDESEEVKKSLEKEGSFIKETVKDVGQKIKDVEAAEKDVNDVVNQGTECVNEMLEEASEKSGKVKKALPEELESIEKSIKDDSKKLRDTLQNEANDIEKKVKEVKEVGSSIQESLNENIDATLKDESEEVKEGLKKEGSILKEAAKDVNQKIKDVGQSVKNIFKRKSEATENEVDTEVDSGTDTVKKVSEGLDQIVQNEASEVEEKIMKVKEIESSVQKSLDQNIDKTLKDESQEGLKKEGSIIKEAKSEATENEVDKEVDSGPDT
uniref:Uncharacterized protein n=1 Tax=Megaselia scalaris TaxID=36166 RepID=T1GT67_MEGSC